MKRLTHEEFLEKLYKINNKIEVLDEYKNNSTKIRCRCKVCNGEWSPIPSNLLKGHGCSICSGNKKYSTDTFVEKLKNVTDDIEVIGDYKSIFEKIKVRYKSCGHECYQIPHDLLQGASCTICSGKNITTYTFEDDVKKINPHVTVTSDYIKMKDKVKVRCNLCGHEREIIAYDLSHRIYNCPICSDNISFPNRLMGTILDENNIDYISEKVFEWSNNKRYDFYIPSTSTIIEVNGEQHYIESFPYRTLEDEIVNDVYKKQLALNNGIQNYIEIDARKSAPEYIINSIRESNLSYLLENINTTKVLKKCLLTSKFLTIIQMRQNGYMFKEIANVVDLNPNTCSRYFNQAKNNNLICNTQLSV